MASRSPGLVHLNADAGADCNGGSVQSRRSMEGKPVMDRVEFEHADNDEVERDNIVQEPRDDQNKDAGDNGDNRRYMGGGDDHDFSCRFLGEIGWG
jgi:hypothetical protein